MVDLKFTNQFQEVLILEVANKRSRVGAETSTTVGETLVKAREQETNIGLAKAEVEILFEEEIGMEPEIGTIGILKRDGIQGTPGTT